MQDEVSKFYQTHFAGHNVIGVHIRGGDGALEYGQLPIPISTYLTETERLFKELGGQEAGVRIFVASNSDHVLLPFQQRYGAATVLSVPDVLHIPTENEGLSAEELLKVGPD
jgi:hypothetical protein